MTGNPVVWWEINAQDGDALARFYRDLFAWDCRLDEGTGIWEIDSSGGRDRSIRGGIFTGKGRLPYHRCLYVEVDDVHAMTAKVEETGLPVLQGPFDAGGGLQLAFFRDPEGHMIGLIERPHGPERD